MTFPRRKLALPGALILLGLIGLLFWITRGPAGGNGGTASVRSPRPPHETPSFEQALERAVEEVRKARKERKPPKGPYALTEAEIDLFLSKRGRNAASLLFVICCTHDRSYLDQVRSLPDSPLKHLVLLKHEPDDSVKLAHATAFLNASPQNKLAAVALARVLQDTGRTTDAAEMLARIPGLPETSGFHTELMEEFTAAREIFGKERGFELLESHGDYWPVNLSRSYLGTYLDSLDFQAVVRDGEIDVTEAGAVAGEFQSSIGYPRRSREQESLLAMRDWIAHNGAKSPTPGIRDLVQRLNDELNGLFLGGMKEEARFQRLREEERWNHLLESYAP